MRLLIVWILVGQFVLASGAAFSQSSSFQQIETQVYRYNNALQYKRSQALLLPMIDDARYSAGERYRAAILLSYTYKRLQDYATTIQFLDKAGQLAAETNRPAENRAQVQAQQAFAYFDIHQYARSDSLMRALQQTHFRHINQEDKAKLVHQQGYLLFLAGNYKGAEATYDRALAELRAADPCDMPMVLVKKMQLYAKTNRMHQALAAFNQSNRQADSCGILKYRIYACSELSEIYKARRDVASVAAMAQILDSLNTIYARAENIATLHNQKAAITQQVSDQHRGQLVKGLSALGASVVLLLAGLLLYRKRQQDLEEKNAQICAELDRYAATRHASSALQSAIKPECVDKLSERQREVLTYMAQGLANREIANRMCVSENTVKYHIKQIYDELAIKNRKELFTRLRV